MKNYKFYSFQNVQKNISLKNANMYNTLNCFAQKNDYIIQLIVEDTEYQPSRFYL